MNIIKKFFNFLKRDKIIWKVIDIPQREELMGRWLKEFPNRTKEEFVIFLNKLNNIESFKISENIWDLKQEIDPETHYLMRLIAQSHLENVFKTLKIDLTDPNVSGEKGTPYRIIKMWTGAGLNDLTELMSGRWAKKAHIPKFPNTQKISIPITKRIDVTSLCSHHLAPFSTSFRPEAFAVVSYIPKDFVLGISKLQRRADHIARRGQLQEDLTIMLYNEISEIAETPDVYVKLYQLVHTCESLRGTQSKDGSFTTEYYGGAFSDPELRKQVQII